MDSMLAKVLESRKKSCAKLVAELGELQVKKAACSTPAAVVAYQGLIAVREARLAKLQAEVKAFEDEAARQTVIPGTESSPPNKSGKR